MLCASLKKHHPEFTVHFAVADEIPKWLNATDEPFDDVISLTDLAIPNLKSWIFRHSIVELSTGIKPFVLRALLAKPDCRAVLYFDPDIVLFSRLDDLLEELDRGSILLTPHQIKPEQSLEAVIDNEICSLRTGIFNLGFLGIVNDSQGRAFTDWWAERLYFFCQADYQRHLFTDQKWVNLAPIFFDGVRILKNSRFNVATWNVTTRRLAGSFQEGFTVDEAPLGFYHFSGFDSGDLDIMANKYAANNSAVLGLIRWYDSETDQGEAQIRWAYGTFSDGKEITTDQRAIYRMRKDLQEAFPDPFAVRRDEVCYQQWFEWRAAIEHPELAATRQSDLPSIPTVNLTPYASWDWLRIKRHLAAAFSGRAQARALLRKTWNVFKKEGLRGVRRRLAARG